MATNTTETRNRLGALPTPTSPASVTVNTFFTNNPTAKNFEPRVGVAWDVFRNGKTVFSAASGLYDILPLNYFLQLQIISSAPSYEEGRVVYSGTTGTGLFPISPFYKTSPLLRSDLHPAGCATQLRHPEQRERPATAHEEHRFPDWLHYIAWGPPNFQHERHQ